MQAGRAGSTLPEGMEAEAGLLAQLSQVPMVSKAWIRQASSDAACISVRPSLRCMPLHVCPAACKNADIMHHVAGPILAAQPGSQCAAQVCRVTLCERAVREPERQRGAPGAEGRPPVLALALRHK
jgi:hypothetical protein